MHEKAAHANCLASLMHLCRLFTVFRSTPRVICTQRRQCGRPCVRTPKAWADVCALNVYTKNSTKSLLTLRSVMHVRLNQFHSFDVSSGWRWRLQWVQCRRKILTRYYLPVFNQIGDLRLHQLRRINSQDLVPSVCRQTFQDFPRRAARATVIGLKHYIAASGSRVQSGTINRYSCLK